MGWAQDMWDQALSIAMARSAMMPPPKPLPVVLPPKPTAAERAQQHRTSRMKDIAMECHRNESQFEGEE
jgi:hypothetical protein